MKFAIALMICFTAFFHCHSEEVKPQLGPLSQLNEFEVCALFPSYGDSDRHALLSTLANGLSEIGDVEIVDELSLSEISDDATVFLLVLGGYQEVIVGSITVISNVEIVANKCKIASPIWQLQWNEKDANATYPFIEDDKVFFKTDESEDEVVSNIGHDVALQQLISEFVGEYRKFNSENEKPKFRLYTKELF